MTGGEAGSHQPKRARIIFRRPSAPGTEVEKPRGISPALKMPPEAAKGFEGMIMTDAQEKILDEMIELEDETYEFSCLTCQTTNTILVGSRYLDRLSISHPAN